MPLVRIDLLKGKPTAFRKQIRDVIYEATRATLNVPADDRFQIVTEHEPENFDIDPTYLGISRSDQAIVIQITLNEGRSTAMKQAFYKAVADGLHDQLSIRREDVFIGLIEVKKENWSFGNGVAQYA